LAAVVAEAGASDLAAAWLDRGLLSGNSGQDLQQRTLEVLAAAYLPQDRFNVGYDHVADLLLGHDRGDSSVPAVRMANAVLLDGTDHTLFFAFQHGSEEIRELGWDSLPKFALRQQQISRRRRSGRRDTNERDPDVIDVLLTVAQGHEEPRYELVEFLRRQPANARATYGLILMVAHGEPDMADRAAEALIGSGRDLAGFITGSELTGDDLHAFARGIYRHHLGHAPLATGLIRQRGRRNNVAQWFLQQVADGSVPPVSQWAQQFGHGRDRNRELLAALQDTNKALRGAAAGALTAAAGGTDEDAVNLLDQVTDVPMGDHEQLKASWFKAREAIYEQRIAASAGSYELTMNMYAMVHSENAFPAADFGRRPGGPMPGPGMMPPGSMSPYHNAVTELPGDARRTFSKSLGIVAMGLEGGEVYFGNKLVYASIPEDHLALRIDEPESLKSLISLLDDISLAESPPVELLPTQGGGWRGFVVLPESRLAELVFEFQDG